MLRHLSFVDLRQEDRNILQATDCAADVMLSMRSVKLRYKADVLSGGC